MFKELSDVSYYLIMMYVKPHPVPPCALKNWSPDHNGSAFVGCHSSISVTVFIGLYSRLMEEDAARQEAVLGSSSFAFTGAYLPGFGRGGCLLWWPEEARAVNRVVFAEQS